MSSANHSHSKSIYNLKRRRSMSNNRYKSQEMSPTIDEGLRKKLFNKRTQPEHPFSMACEKYDKFVSTQANANEIWTIFNRKEKNQCRSALRDIEQQNAIFENKSLRQRNFSQQFPNSPQLSSRQISEVQSKREAQEGQQIKLFGNQRVAKRNFSEAFSDRPLSDNLHYYYDDSENPHDILTLRLKHPQTNSPNSDTNKRSRRMSYFLHGTLENGDELRENVSINANTKKI